MEAQRQRMLKPTHDISSGTLTYSKLLSDMLTFHNYYRARHSASPLTISQRLNIIAQSYAEHLASTSKFEHSGNLFQNDILGENLYMQWISKGHVPVSASAAVKSWYEEIDLYDFKRPNYSEETGHFTQMVWKSTIKMGMGVAVSADGREVYFVTNYYPAGNIVNHGYFETNVLSH
jgi:glioma pathogenesis-related protein 2